MPLFRGFPFDGEALEKVNAFAARRVILLHPHESDSEVGPGGYSSPRHPTHLEPSYIPS
jgi:hypothetical protein